MTSMGSAMEGPEQIVLVDSDDESSQKCIGVDKEQRFPATEESNESGSVAPGKTVGDSSRSQSQVKGNAESNADADDAEGAENNGKQSERVDANGKGGATGDGGPQAKRQKVEQQNEVPLLIPGSVCKDSKASLLMHLRDEKLDLSGDTGAVGRIAVGGKKKGRELTFDLKGQQFSGQIIPSATVLVVGVGRTEAKIEGIFSEVCRLDYKRNVLEAMGGEVLKGEMDQSYRYEEEDVNVKGATDAGERGTDEAGAKGAGGGGVGKTPKPGRKKTPAKKKLGSKGAKSSSGKGK